MNARLIEKATTLKTTKGESQNAFKRINQAKVSAIRLTHTGREVSPSGLKPNSRISVGDPLRAALPAVLPLTKSSGTKSSGTVPGFLPYFILHVSPSGLVGLGYEPKSGGLRTPAGKCRPPG